MPRKSIGLDGLGTFVLSYNYCVKKKVLIFIPEFPVVTETFISREVSKLVERGNLDVVILSLKRGEGTFLEGLENKVVYKRLDVLNLLLGLSYLITRPRRVFDTFNLIRNPYLFLKSLGYSKIFSRYNPDVIYSHFLSEFSTIALAASKLLNVQLAVSAHARDVLENAELVKEKVKYSKFITICNENAWRKVIKLSGVDIPNNVYRVYHGIDEKDLQGGKKIEKQSIPVIYSIGRLVQKKGLTYLVKASKILKEKGIEHKVYIAGPGPLFDELKGIISKYELNDCVELLGGVSFDEILGFFKAADMFVLPSIDTEMGDADGIPNVLIEAALLRVPIITTNAGGISEFISSTEGIVIPQRDSKTLAMAIEKLISDSDFAQDLLQNAYTKAKEMFDLNTNVAEIERLLLE